MQRGERGFNLMEVMLAMAIFAVGFTALASMFVVAGTLQKQTINDVHELIVSRNAEAIALSLPMDDVYLDARVPLDQKAHPLLQWIPSVAPVHYTPTSETAPRTLSDDLRSYPSVEPIIADRKFFWVPFIRRTAVAASDPYTQPQEWQLFVFLVERQTGAVYTKTAGDYNNYGNPNDASATPAVKWQAATADTVARRFNFTNNAGGNPALVTGDWILDEYGSIYSVKTADLGGVEIAGAIIALQPSGTLPAGFWFGALPDSGRASTGRRIMVFSDAVK